ncbi:hypothetical protein B0F90DRAFT_1813930 [Multifurca ochricompacta]|uniref:Uncharacterized protein n=1 Tax=Multifurca ochricompacta TaxID=376703 RepID=A0AAD4MB45_9AGAM|nr:hypothetical protein B0F90DRAFT_1813930 [Multifurca ochricompacta]
MAPDFDFESSDILGGALPVGRGRVSQHSSFSFFFKICALGAGILFLLLAFRHGRVVFLRWKEKHYKLSMRRRYGIPDNDLRPFNVAYAAAKLAQEDKRRLQEPVRKVSTFDPLNRVSYGSRTGESCVLAQQHVTPITLQVSGHDRNDKPTTKRSPFSVDTVSPPSRVPTLSGRVDIPGPHLRLPSRENFVDDLRDEESGDQPEARQGSDYTGHDSGIEVDPVIAPKRSKRVADSSDDGDLRSTQENHHDKRRRKVSIRYLRKRVQSDEDVEMEDGAPEVRDSRSGKKRDRAEVDSSFEADDDLIYNDRDPDPALRRHRKRRQRKTTNALLGQKRSRDIDMGADTDIGNSRGKGKAFRHRPDTSDTDPSTEDMPMSTDPLCKGRRLGEEWEVHGVQFKVGPDGRRLRKVLVKEDRPKFNMPVDSEHPDRSAFVTAIIERWYTEEQHAAAKEARELAWQDADKSSSVELETSSDRIRWQAASVGRYIQRQPIRKIRSSGHSSAIASPRMILLSIPSPPQYSRRVSSLYSSSVVRPAEMSPKLRPSKSYSKWEKQEIEAETIARLRRKAGEKEKAKAEAEAKETEARRVIAAASALPSTLATKSDEKSSAAPAPQTVAPTFSLPPAPSAATSQAVDSTQPPFLFKIPTPLSGARPSEATDNIKSKTTPALAGTLFSFSAAVPAISTSTSTSAANDALPSSLAVPKFFPQNAPPTTAPTSTPDANGSAAPSIFSFGQAKPLTSNPIVHGSSAPPGAGPSTAPQGLFSFPRPSDPSAFTTNSSNPSSGVLPTGGTGDAPKPKFNFGIASKAASTPSSNPSLSPATSNLPKSIFDFGSQKGPSTVQTITNPFGNASVASATTATQANQPLVFGTTSDGSLSASSALSPASGIKLEESSGPANQGQSVPTEAAARGSVPLFGAPSGGVKAQDAGSIKASPFAPTSVTTEKPIFSFSAAPETSRGIRPEPGKGATGSTFGVGTSSSSPAAIPPTPGSVFSDYTTRGSQDGGPIAQPLFGVPKNSSGEGSSGFTFGPSSAPFSFESVTAHHIHALANDVFSGDVPSAIEEWINERSREELSSLLVRANEIIRERERELTVTSELSKSLYNSNVTLEEKHKALLARLPSASSMTPRTTPSSSPAPTPEYQPNPLPHLRTSHTRRISVSPSDLAHLADQNAELLQKLEKLEAESAQVNLAGRRRLGKLEKEIDVLREELDQYRTQNDALQLQVEGGEEEARRRRQEWNDRVKAHRSNKSGSSWTFSEAEGNVRNFAPSSGRPAESSTVFKPVLPSAPDTVSLPPSHTDSDSPAEASSALPSSAQPSPAISLIPLPESALVAQLVSKVRELETTNEQILESQRDTTTKLHEALTEAEGIRRLYAFLDEQADVELEVVENSEHEGRSAQDVNHTISFQSLRRSINGDLRKLATSSIKKGTELNMEGTLDSSGPIKSAPLKVRKTVVGLFDTPSQPTRDDVEPASMISNPSSPALSLLDLPTGSLFSRQASRGPTLGSELGSDYGGDYAENHHLRSSSLYDVFLSGPSPSLRPATPMSPQRDTQCPYEPQLAKPAQDLDKTPQKPSPKASHQHRLSDTIRARTHYWVDKRFHYTTPIRRPSNLYDSEAGTGSSSSKPVVAQAAVQTMPSDGMEEDLALIKINTTRELQNTFEIVEPKRSRAMRVVLELWLWMQFMIVIMVFLWAVTKRGPRNVLRNAERIAKRIQ